MFICIAPILQISSCPLQHAYVCLSQVNLRYGVTGKNARTGHEQDTCTACGGSMILEFAALSRLTGNKVYEVCTRGKSGSYEGSSCK